MRSEMHWENAQAIYGTDLGLRRTRSRAIKYAQIHPEPIAVRDAFIAIRCPEDLAGVLTKWYLRPSQLGTEARRCN